MAHDLVLAATLGLFSAVLGIVLMRGVAICENMFARLRLRPTLRTMAGGIVVGLLAIVSPQVMSSGHGALRVAGMLDLSFAPSRCFFVLKIVASIASLGSGFRGGMFFSSLLIGALGGHLLAVALTMIWPTVYFDPNAYAVIGMSALAASVIGGPLTMIFIALETTGDLWLTTAVLIAVIISAQMTREVFGYSFATWRFHLRGETIRSAADVGWMRELTVEKMMRQDVQTVNADDDHRGVSRDLPAQLDGLCDRGRRGRSLCRAWFWWRTRTPPKPRRTSSIKELFHYRDEMLLPGHGGQGSGARLRPRRGGSTGGRRFLPRPARRRAADRSLRAAPLCGGAGRPPPRSGRRELDACGGASVGIGGGEERRMSGGQVLRRAQTSVQDGADGNGEAVNHEKSNSCGSCARSRDDIGAGQAPQVSDSDIVEAYDYMLARWLVLRQEALDLNDGFNGMWLIEREPGGVNPGQSEP